MERLLPHVAPTLFLAGLLALAYGVMKHFIVPVAWAAILVYMSWPLYAKLASATGGRGTLAALVMTAALSSLIVAPLTWASILTQREIVEFYGNLPAWLELKPALPEFATRIPLLGGELQALLEQFDDLRALLRERGVPWLRQISGQLFGVMGNLGYFAAQTGFTLLTVFFLYRDGRIFIKQIRTVLSRALGARLEGYIATVERTVKAVMHGIVLTAMAQASLAGIGYWFVGLNAPVLLALVTLFFALIPFGTPLVWGSASLWLLAQGEIWPGVSLILWGSLVVSWIDNLVRPLIISGTGKFPFLLVMFGVLGGLARFGMIGLFVGPVVLAVSLAVWRGWLAEAHTNETV
jgi:predicted PurR-regulated permease PerM